MALACLQWVCIVTLSVRALAIISRDQSQCSPQWPQDRQIPTSGLRRSAPCTHSHPLLSCHTSNTSSPPRLGLVISTFTRVISFPPATLGKNRNGPMVQMGKLRPIKVERLNPRKALTRSIGTKICGHVFLTPKPSYLVSCSLWIFIECVFSGHSLKWI